MTLEAIIKQKIRARGPMNVATYMSLALTHPEYGYYTNKDPLGSKGDFITSPEICQIFGELIGAWLAQQWSAMGKPRAALVEPGPGRGTLMADILRATKNVPGFHDAISVHLIEVGKTLQQKQWNTLAGKHPDIHWHESLEELPEKAMLLVANEFFDALPIRQYVYLDDGWHERMIALSETGHLEFTIPADAGRVVERCEAGKEWIALMAKHMMSYGGAALIIDYGYDGPPKNSRETLQAMCDHQFHDVLMNPGGADITAHVDFLSLREVASVEGIVGYPLLGQGQFLMNIGAAERTAMLCQTANEEQKATMISSMERLISPKQMGELFKVLCLTHPNHPRPEGV